MPAPVQTNKAEFAATGVSVAIAQGSNPTIGNVNVVWVTSDGGVTITSVTDTLGHTYTARGVATEAATNIKLFQFTAPITSTGANTVTANFSSTITFRGIVVSECQGVYDASNTGTDTGNNPTTALAATNSAQPATCYMLGHFVQGGTPTVGTGYSDGGLQWTQPICGVSRVQYKGVVTVASQTGDFGNSSLDRATYAMVILLDGAAPPPARLPIPEFQTGERFRETGDSDFPSELNIKAWF